MSVGIGFMWVWVWVGMMSPMGYPRQTLLRATPCYDTFPFPAPIEGFYHTFLNIHDFDRTAIKEVEALEDHGILAEVY